MNLKSTSWALFMPTPAENVFVPVNFKLWLPLKGLKLGGKGLGLRFGYGEQLGRLVGLGLHDDRTGGDEQYFRMDYHEPHTRFHVSFTKKPDVYYVVDTWDGFTFNYHISRKGFTSS